MAATAADQASIEVEPGERRGSLRCSTGRPGWLLCFLAISLVVATNVDSLYSSMAGEDTMYSGVVDEDVVAGRPDDVEPDDAMAASGTLGPTQSPTELKHPFLNIGDPIFNSSMSRFKAELRGLGKIPRRIHIAWRRKIDLDGPPPSNQSVFLRYGLRSLRRLNPDWTIEMNDDADICSYIESKLKPSDWNLVKHAHIVPKTDLWRLLKMLHEGGVYTDIDRIHNRPLPPLLADERIKMLLPMFGELNGDKYEFMDFSQDFMCTAPGNPLYKAAVEQTLERYRNRASSEKTFESEMDSLAFTSHAGSIAYINVISKHVFGVTLGGQPGHDISEILLGYVDRLRPEVLPFRESPPLITVTKARDKALDKSVVGEWDRYKKEFYDAEGVLHWEVAMSAEKDANAQE